MKLITSLAVALLASVSASAQKVIPATTPTGSGTADYVPLWTTTTTLGNSLLFESGGKVGVGTTSPLAFFDIPVTTTSTANSQALRGSIDVTPSASSSAIYEGVRGQAYDSGATNSIGQLKGFVAYTKSGSNQNVGAMYGLFSESQVSKSGGTASQAYGAYANAVETEGTLTTGYGLYAQAQGAMTTGYGVYSSIINYGGGKPATGYGVYIAPLVVSGSSYGLYQAGASDSNYFAGPLQVNGAATFNSAVTFAQPINGSLNLTGSINDVLTLENSVYDPNCACTSANVIAGYSGNSVTSAATGATIAGGGQAGFPGSNTVSADFGTVGGGEGNTASGLVSTVGGGIDNAATGMGATVAGGGSDNVAGAAYATVAGGELNTAGGELSFAAGFIATTTDTGSFVWCQQAGYPNYPGCYSNGTNSFTVAVDGPIYFYAGTPGQGCYLSTGSGSWTCSTSDSLKDNIRRIDSRRILERVAQMPISEWSMKGDSSGYSHIGPMAQDFYAAFGLGDSDKYIAQGDAQGVALAAIQGLYQLMQEDLQQSDDRIGKAEAQLKALGERLDLIKR